MHDLDLTDIKAFHADIMSVATAGVALAGGPLEEQQLPKNRGWLGADQSTVDVGFWRESLLTVEQRLASARLDGRPLLAALESETGVAANYLNALRAWLATGRDPDSLNAWSTTALRARRQQWRQRVRWVQPLIWLTVGYCGLMFISLAVAPLFLSFARQARLSPGTALETLLEIRAAAPIWGILVPLLIAAWAIYLYGCDRPARFSASVRAGTLLDQQPDAGTLCRGAVEGSHGLDTGVAGVLLGGLLAFGIAMCVFGPLIELLYSVALPVEVTHVGL